MKINNGGKKMEGKGIRSEEGFDIAKYIYGTKRVLERFHELEWNKENANSEGSNTPWTKEEEKELRTLDWVADLLVGAYGGK